MSNLNPIIYQIKKEQQLINLINDISAISLDKSLMDQSNLSSLTFPLYDFLYILLPNDIQFSLHNYTYIPKYINKKLYIKNDLIDYTFPDNIQNLSYYIKDLIKYNPYLLEIKIPETYVGIDDKILGFILTEKNNNGYNVYYKLFVEKYIFIKNNASEEELDKIIQIFKICQPLELYIPIIYQNHNKMKSFLDKYYNFFFNELNEKYFIRKVYKIEQDLPVEDYKQLIRILFNIKPVQLSIHNSYVTNLNYKSNEDLTRLLYNYILRGSNVDDYIYYEERTHPPLPPR